jgi:hypothetical protein
MLHIQYLSFQCSWNACQQHAEDCGDHVGLKLVCTYLEPRSELVCTGMFWYALVCIGMF